MRSNWNAVHVCIWRCNNYSSHKVISDAVNATSHAALYVPCSLLRERVAASLRSGTVDSYYAAIADLGQLIKSFPQELDLLEMRGTAYFNLGEIDGAQNHFTTCLKSEAEHKGCKKEHKVLKAVKKKLGRSVSASEMGNNEEAASYLREVRALLEERSKEGGGKVMTPAAVADLCLIKLVKELSGIDAAEAVKVGREMLQSHDSPEACISLGEALIAAEQYQEAVNVLKEGANRHSPGNLDHLKEAIKKAEVALKQSKV